MEDVTHGFPVRHATRRLARIAARADELLACRNMLPVLGRTGEAAGARKSSTEERQGLWLILREQRDAFCRTD